jgi:hypothetical protein
LLDSSKPQGVALGVQIDALLDALTNDLSAWRNLTARFDADLCCGAHLDAANRGLCLSARVLGRLAERGIDLSLDIYCYCP